MIRCLVLYFFLLFISIIDGLTFKIPDILLILLSSILCIYDFGSGRLQLQQFGTALLLFLLFYIVYRLVGGLGFGDVKLAAVIGYAAGFPDALYGCISACFLAIIFMVGKYGIKKQKRQSTLLSRRIPFAPFLSAGLLIEQLASQFALMIKL